MGGIALARVNLPTQLSVITPVLNGIRFIESCIRNVIDQQCGEVEHVIVDGGSTDGTVELIRKYAGEHAHIRWLSEADQGQAHAMNKGIARANGKILGFLSVADYYEPGALPEIVASFAGLPEPTLVVGNCNVWDDDGKLLSVSKPAEIGLLNLLKGKYDVALPRNSSAYFYHKSLHELIGPYNVKEQLSTDVHFIFRAVQNARVGYLDKTLGNYRYIRGTKMFDDVESGRRSTRVQLITSVYRRQQPAYVRGWLQATEIWARLFPPR
jgi:glycosyltransferase involved in cell wall biosynthesis